LSAFPNDTPANERLLAVMLREVGEAIEKHIVAEGTPSAENCADAVREGREAAAIIELRNAALEQGLVS
jgi:acetylglutamate kinase